MEPDDIYFTLLRQTKHPVAAAILCLCQDLNYLLDEDRITEIIKRAMSDEKEN